MANSFDMEQYASQVMGADIRGKNEDGSLKLATIDTETGEEVERDFDVNGFLQSKGVDPATVNLRINSPDTAFEENGLGFSAAIKTAWGRTPKDKINTLENEFGKENVSVTRDGSIKVKENGAWKSADPSFLQNIAANSPEMVAGVAGTAGGAAAGAAIGAGIGTFFGGVGAIPGAVIGAKAGGLIGGIFGGSLSAAVAKWGKEEVAEKLNLRTEADGADALEEIKKEFAHNLVWDVALLGTGKVLKPVGKYMGRNLKSMADNFIDKETMAATAKALFPGTLADDWASVLKSSKDATQILGDMDAVIKHTKSGVDGIDPATKAMNNLGTKAMRVWHGKAKQTYNRAMGELEKNNSFHDVKIQAQPLLSKFGEALDDLGLRSLDEAGNVRFLSGKLLPNDSPAKAIMDPKGLRSMQKVYDILEKASGFERNAGQRVFDPHLGKYVLKAKPQGMLQWKEAKQMLSGIDDILEGSGFFKGGDMAIGSQSRRILKGVRADLRKTLSNSLSNKSTIRVNGKLTSARALYETASGTWHNFRNAYDDFALPSKFGSGDASRVQATIQRMIGEKGAGLEESFGAMAKAVGHSADPVIGRMKQLRAGKNLSAIYASNTGIGAVIKKDLGLSPRRQAGRFASAAKGFEVADALKQTPISQKTISAMQSLGKGAAWLNNLPPGEKIKFLSTPNLYNQFIETIFSAPDMEAQQTQQLMQGVQGNGQ